MTTKEIKAYKNEIFADFKKIGKAVQDGEIESPDEHEDWREPLEISKLIEITVLLSWGGPSDGFKIMYNPVSKEFVSGVYFLQDWGSYEESDLDEDEIQTVVNTYDLECAMEQ